MAHKRRIYYKVYCEEWWYYPKLKKWGKYNAFEGDGQNWRDFRTFERAKREGLKLPKGAVVTRMFPQKRGGYICEDFIKR